MLKCYTKIAWLLWGLLLDTVLTIKERYKLDEQTAVEILKMKVLCESLNGI